MQKYLTQHGLKAFTILLPRNFNLKNKSNKYLENDFFISASDMFVSQFAAFIKANSNSNFDNLPSFNFLTVFYDVSFVEEIDDLLKFDLILNESLNKTMWLRLKHTVFNQYNALIGFSDILNEVENLDDTDRLLIKRINNNVREMFKNTKLYMEFEKLKDFNFELKSRLVSPVGYISSFLRHRRDKEEGITFKYNPEDFKNIALNIDNEFLKISLDLLFDALKEIVDLSKTSLELQVTDQCVWRLDTDTFDDTEFAYELQLINDFYGRGIDISHLSTRMFHFIYIRLVIEKLGGEFSMTINELPNPQLLVEWFFPYTEQETTFVLDIDERQADKKADKKPVFPEETSTYPLALKQEIGRHFLDVDGAFVLDDWKVFASKLDILIIKYKASDVSELRQIVDDIYSAVKSFDVTALQLIMKKLKQISKME